MKIIIQLYPLYSILDCAQSCTFFLLFLNELNVSNCFLQKKVHDILGI